jgi:hypothetical protein
MTRNSFDLTRGCRTGHWDLTTLGEILPKKHYIKVVKIKVKR